MQSLTRALLKEKLPELERALHVKFKDQKLLELACIHKSYVNEHRDEPQEHNERLEFLGDAVLELVTTEFLYAKYPTREEGELTSFRSALVKGNHLSNIAMGLKFGQFLLLSHGEERSGGRTKNYLLANMMEAIIGAMYLDRGFATCHRFILRAILTHIDDIVDKGLYVDAKSKLQERAQEEMGLTPTYQVLGKQGPDHSSIFEVAVLFGTEVGGKGHGSSKQKAEQSAAEDALAKKKW